MTEYKNPAVTVDIVVFTYEKNDLKVLLIQRKYPPFKDHWAIPGGFVDYDEDIETAAHRELEEETSINDLNMHQVQAFGSMNRDPRGRTISIAYYTAQNISKLKIKAQSDAKNAQLFSIKDLPELAFDHKEILKVAVKKLKQSIEVSPIAINLLPSQFAMQDLKTLYEMILDKQLAESVFIEEINRSGFLSKIDENFYTLNTANEVFSRFN